MPVTFDPQRVREQLAALRAADRGLTVFGANSHKYRLRKPLNDREVALFEKRHGITLPAEYRMFITDLGNGGGGPFYGIFKLGEMDDADGYTTWREGDGFVGDLGRPFPHRRAWNLPASRLEPPESFDSDEQEEAWHEALDAEYWSPALVNGAVPICHHGCALRTWLVVTGPEAGKVWYDGRADDAGLRPHQGAHGRHLTFGAWYEQWLDRSLAGLRT